MIINRNKSVSSSYTYNKEKGSVEYRSIKDTPLNKWLNKCNDQYEGTCKGEDPSVFLPIILFTIFCWVIIFFMYLCIGGFSTLTGVYWTIGICTLVNLSCILVSERCVFWYVPIFLSLILLAYVKYAAPYIVHKHAESCETSQTIIKTGKLDDNTTCIYEGYIINHLNEFK